MRAFGTSVYVLVCECTYVCVCEYVRFIQTLPFISYRIASMANSVQGSCSNSVTSSLGCRNLLLYISMPCVCVHESVFV